MVKPLKSIEIDLDKHIYKINGEETDEHQKYLEITCRHGIWNAKVTVDVYYNPSKKE